MLRIAIIPASLLLAYVYFTPIEPFDLIEGDLGSNLTLPEEIRQSEESASAEQPDEAMILPLNPAYGSRVVTQMPADPSNGGRPADMAQALTEMVDAADRPAEDATVEAEDIVIPDMAVEETIEVADQAADVEEPAIVEPAFDERAIVEPAVEGTTESEPVEGDTAEQTTETETPEPPAAEPKPPLTPAMAAVRDRLRRTTTSFYRRLPTSGTNTATDLMHYCLAFGCDSQVAMGTSSSAKKLNGITHLCWNYPSGGFEPLALSNGRIAAKLGYGVQHTPAQLLAVLAMSRVQLDYPARVGEHVATVAELVEHEKLSCRTGDDHSLKLIGLSYYVDESTWTNRQGEEWSIERMVGEELDKPMPAADARGTSRLMGLSQAVAQRVSRGLPVEGQLERARKFVADYQDYALTLQNSDGGWGPYFLAAKATSHDQATQLRSTGHVLEWLVMSLPEEQLEDARIVRSVEYVGRLLGSSRYRNGVHALSTREIESVMHALHALMVYDQRYLAPRTPKPEEAETAAAPQDGTVR